jgi:PrgI family protein
MSYEVRDSAKIPADIERPDKIVAGLTARQVAILAVAGVVLWLIYLAVRRVVPGLVFAGAAAPFAVLTVALALGQRDGLSLDRLAAAALRQVRAPRRLVTAPEGVVAAPQWAGAAAGPHPAPAAVASSCGPGRWRRGPGRRRSRCPACLLHRQLRAGHPGRAGRNGRGAGRVAQLAHRSRPDSDPGRACRSRPGNRAAGAGRERLASPRAGGGGAGARGLPRRCGGVPRSAVPAGAGGHARTRAAHGPRYCRRARRDVACLGARAHPRCSAWPELEVQHDLGCRAERADRRAGRRLVTGGAGGLVPVPRTGSRSSHHLVRRVTQGSSDRTARVRPRSLTTFRESTLGVFSWL